LIQYAERDSATAGLTNARRAAGNTDTGEITGYESEGVDDQQRVDGRRTKNFEKRARHKMLDPVKKGQKKTLKKAQPANKLSKKKRKGKGEVAARNKTDALVEGFSAENIAKQRITVRKPLSHVPGLQFLMVRHSYNRRISLGFSEMAGHPLQFSEKAVCLQDVKSDSYADSLSTRFDVFRGGLSPQEESSIFRSKGSQR
jgi:hypothetical protein